MIDDKVYICDGSTTCRIPRCVHEKPHKKNSLCFISCHYGDTGGCIETYKHSVSEMNQAVKQMDAQVRSVK